MKFDTWLLRMYKLTWDMYLDLPETIQDKLANEYESSVQGWK